MEYELGKVSVIIPVYNAEKFLKRAIDSIVAQTWDNWELLLADDCSTDGSRDIMRNCSDSRIRCFFSEKNAGPAHARNLALSHAKGQYIAFLDADDFWVPDKMERQIAFMRENKYAFSFTSYAFADENANRSGVIAHAPKAVDYQSILRSSTIAPSTAMLDRQQIDSSLIYMPENVRLEDAATWMQIMKTGVHAYGLDEVYTIYCRHKGAYSANKFDAVLGKWKLYRKVEKFSVIKSLYYVCINTWAAILRRL